MQRRKRILSQILVFAAIVALVMIVMPVFVHADDQACDPTKQICNPLRFNSLPCFFKEVLRIAAEIGSVFVVLGLIYSGFLFVAARGNENELTKAKHSITYTIIGALLVFGAWSFSVGIANTINTMLSNSPTTITCP